MDSPGSTNQAINRIMVRFLMMPPLKRSITDTSFTELRSVGFFSCPAGSSVPLPEASRARTALASGSRPRTSNHRGDSGTSLRLRLIQQFNMKAKSEKFSWQKVCESMRNRGRPVKVNREGYLHTLQPPLTHLTTFSHTTPSLSLSYTHPITLSLRSHNPNGTQCIKPLLKPTLLLPSSYLHKPRYANTKTLADTLNHLQFGIKYAITAMRG